MQIIAGPGTGKTFVLILRTLYLLLSEKANPSEILLTTFTEKATFELRDRVSQIARKLDYKGQLHDLKVGTIHSICNDFIGKYLPYTPLKKNFIVLDELTQSFFLYEHFDEIVGKPANGLFLGKWSTKWTTITNMLPYFNKLTEELVGIEKLKNTENVFLCQLADTYLSYQKFMYENNRVDFSHLQKIFLDMLKDKQLYDKIKGNIKYIMVDEYQDTNYIQEQIFLTLAKPDYNICVVGDEDQALYRFRGATVRNILEFQKNFKNCQKIVLSMNYRSHKNIITAYNRFMGSIEWGDSNGRIFRFPKTIKVNPEENFPDYPSVFCIWGANERDEAERCAGMIKFFKENQIIQDYSQVALLLKSVRLDYSGHYLDALTKNNIPYFNPRAKAYFENEEVLLMMACYAIIFGMYKEALQNSEISEYIGNSTALLGQKISPGLQNYLQIKVKQISLLKHDESLDLSIVDYFYQLLAYEPFSSMLADENRARNLSIFSSLISTFQVYYEISLVTFKNKDLIKFYLFNSYFRFLVLSGFDEYENPDNPIPRGYVQIMTIHQSKGLEFSVVIVGSINQQFKVTTKHIDRDLEPFYPRGSFEPEDKITEFDRMRHFYVAFSRAEKILVLTTTGKPKEWFWPIWEGLDQWPYIEKETLQSLKFIPKPQFIPKKSYSLSSHINIYETCPKQYLFYREYDFAPSRVGGVLFGTLVHQTIEDIHHQVLNGNLNQITSEKIDNWFEQNYRTLVAGGFRPLGQTYKENALKQVFSYFNQNQEELKRIIEAEVDVSIEKEDYIMVGKIDLLLGRDGKLEVLDFKTQLKPNPDDPLTERYFKQLCLYAHILRERYGKNPERLLIYWTAEQKKKDALDIFEYTEKNIKEAGEHFDGVVKKIRARQFDVKSSSDARNCKDCDFRFYCSENEVIKFKAKELIQTQELLLHEMLKQVQHDS